MLGSLLSLTVMHCALDSKEYTLHNWNRGTSAPQSPGSQGNRAEVIYYCGHCSERHRFASRSTEDDVSFVPCLRRFCTQTSFLSTVLTVTCGSVLVHTGTDSQQCGRLLTISLLWQRAPQALDLRIDAQVSACAGTERRQTGREGVT